MADLVRVRHKKGPRREFLISRGLHEKHPDDYVVVKSDQSPKADATAEKAK